MTVARHGLYSLGSVEAPQIVSAAIAASDSANNSDALAGNFTVASTSNIVLVAIWARQAGGTELTFANGTVTLNGVTVTEISSFAATSNQIALWLGIVTPDATGAVSASCNPDGGTTGCRAIACIEISGANATPVGDGPDELKVQTAAMTMTDVLTMTSAAGLALLFVGCDGGDTDPGAGNNDTLELLDGTTGAGSEDTIIWVGYKYPGATGATTLGADWSASDEWCSTIVEILPA